MAFGQLKGPDSTSNAKLSPERQMAKMRENARSGGGGGYGYRNEPRPPIESPVIPASSGIDGVQPPAPAEKGIILELTPDANDKDMEHLLGVLREKGFSAALKALEEMDNPHLEDDFHRLLVQYKKEGHQIPGLDPDDPMSQSLDTVLLEVAVPETGSGKPGGSLKEVVVQMEQFYQAVIPQIAIPDVYFLKDFQKRKSIHKQHFTMEIAVSHTNEDAVFYLSVPRAKRDFFEKQIFAIFPRARVTEKKDDYNAFNQFGYTAVASAMYKRPAPMPIKTIDDFSYDPLNIILASLSKIAQEGEGAAVQITVAAAGDYHTKRMRKVLDDLNKGAKSPGYIFLDHMYEAPEPLWRQFLVAAKKEATDIVKSAGSSGGEKKAADKHVDSITVEAVNKKLKSVIVGVNVRIAASARTKERASAILSELESSFGQYEDAKGNRFKFKIAKSPKEKRKLLRQFIFRLFDRDAHEALFPQLIREFSKKVPTPQMEGSPVMPMNLQELSTLFHWAIAGGTASREAKTSSAKLSPAPPGLPQQGITIGRNRYSNIETMVHFGDEDRLRHMYTIGQTGTGKTSFLKHMILQDIERGAGVCFIDPHGVDVQEILSLIPKERYDDVIYFDPAYTQRPMGLNMLEYDPRFPEQKTFVVDEMFKIFKKLYGDVPEAFGPIFEQYFRNATLLVLEDPETGSTLMDISRVLADDNFRALKLSRSRNSVVNHFWEDIAENVRGEGDLRNVVPYITSKFDIFIANEIMRPIVGQQRSAFDFKDIMDNRKILLVNLSKGRLGDLNSNLLGLVIVGKIMMTALARTDYLHTNPPNFYLYIDEFQNVTTNTIATILSEARKFRLSLTIAHQYISQLSKEIKESVFGNVGTMATFRVGTEDAEFMAKQYQPVFDTPDFFKLDNRHAYLKLLAGGKPITPFSIETIHFQSGDPLNMEALKQMSYQRFGRNRDAVEEEINTKYNQMRDAQTGGGAI